MSQPPRLCGRADDPLHDPGRREITTCAYDEGGRITTVDGVAYTYENRGNLKGDGAWTYTYDGAGRMVRAARAASVYTYNGDGLLVSETLDGAETLFTWDQAAGLPQVLATSDGTKNLYGLERIGVEQGGAWRYPLPDALGSVRQWTDPAGAVLGVQSYGPFGEPRSPVGTPPWGRTSLAVGGVGRAPKGFTGEWQDPAGMVYLRARWYNPGLGRFSQVDPVAGNLAAPATQHAYTYAFNNPLGFTDPAGTDGHPIEEAPDWLQWIVGAGMQFADNVFLGVPGRAAESLTGRRWTDVGGPAFHKGREYGTVLSTLYGTYHTVMGSVRMLSAFTTILPTGGLVAALEGPTGGTVTLPGGLVISVEAALALSGGLEAGYGVGVMACAARNRFPQSSGSEGDSWPRYRPGDKTPRGRELTGEGARRANQRRFTAETIDSIIDNNGRTRVKEIDSVDGSVAWRYQDRRGNTVITSEWGDRVVTVYSPAPGGMYISK